MIRFVLYMFFMYFDHVHNCSYRMEAIAAERKQLKELAYQLAAEGQSAEQSLKDMRKQTANKLDLAGKLCQDHPMSIQIGRT